jgi:hypothetical protein
MGSCSHNWAEAIARAIPGHSGLVVADLQLAQAGVSDIAKRAAETQTTLHNLSPGFMLFSQIFRPRQG